jgi:hypothetical protein
VPDAGAGRLEGFVGAVVAEQPAKKEIHIILDNLSTHKTKRVRDFLALHKNVHLHFTLKRKFMRDIREHNKTTKPIKWKYADPRRRIQVSHAALSSGTGN